MSQGGHGGVVRSLLWRERQRQWQQQGFTNGKALVMAVVDDAMMCDVDVMTDVCGMGPGVQPQGEGATNDKT